MCKKEKSNVQKAGSAQKIQASETASGDVEVRAAMCRVGRLILDHPIVQLGLRVGDVEQRRDIAVIRKWVEQEEPNGGTESASETTE